jgi:hypothetical protein
MLLGVRVIFRRSLAVRNLDSRLLTELYKQLFTKSKHLDDF